MRFEVVEYTDQLIVTDRDGIIPDIDYVYAPGDEVTDWAHSVCEVLNQWVADGVVFPTIEFHETDELWEVHHGPRTGIENTFETNSESEDYAYDYLLPDNPTVDQQHAAIDLAQALADHAWTIRSKSML